MTAGCPCQSLPSYPGCFAMASGTPFSGRGLAPQAGLSEGKQGNGPATISFRASLPQSQAAALWTLPIPPETLPPAPSQARQTPLTLLCGPLYVTAVRNEVQMSFSKWQAPADGFCLSVALIAVPSLPFMPCSAQTPSVSAKEVIK